MTFGEIVWVVIGAGWVVWLVVTQVVTQLPGIDAVVRAFLGSWLGRMIALAAWAEAGWHIFGQRP